MLAPHLLDTHTLLWRLSDDPRLGNRARSLIAHPSNSVLVSCINLWEALVNIRVGKLTADIGANERAVDGLPPSGWGVTPAHLTTLASLPLHHLDPFDHLLIALTITKDAAFISQDEVIARYPVHLERCADL